MPQSPFVNSKLDVDYVMDDRHKPWLNRGTWRTPPTSSDVDMPLNGFDITSPPLTRTGRRRSPSHQKSSNSIGG